MAVYQTANHPAVENVTVSVPINSVTLLQFLQQVTLVRLITRASAKIQHSAPLQPHMPSLHLPTVLREHRKGEVFSCRRLKLRDIIHGPLWTRMLGVKLAPPK